MRRRRGAWVPGCRWRDLPIHRLYTIRQTSKQATTTNVKSSSSDYPIHYLNTQTTSRVIPFFAIQLANLHCVELYLGTVIGHQHKNALEPDPSSKAASLSGTQFLCRPCGSRVPPVTRNLSIFDWDADEIAKSSRNASWQLAYFLASANIFLLEHHPPSILNTNTNIHFHLPSFQAMHTM